jgi:NmrA-like family
MSAARLDERALARSDATLRAAAATTWFAQCLVPPTFSKEEAHMKVCVVGASGKLGRYMVRHALDRGYEVVGVCREQSVPKLDEFKGRITFIPGMTDNRDVIKKAVIGCDTHPARHRR